MASETILLDVQIDQSDAQKQLVQTEKNLLSLKKQQAELNKEYKSGKISQDDYVEANLRLQKSIARENDQKKTLNRLIDTESNSRNALKNQVSTLTKEYDNLNTKTAEGAKREKELAAELKNLNEEITKSSKSAGLFKDQIGNYPDKFAQATNEIKPFGVSVDGATSSIAKFANPATAVVGVLAGLGAAYASSTAGAKDLAFAQDRLGFITSSLVEKFGTLVSGSGESGGGALNKLLDFAIKTGGAVTGLGFIFGGFIDDLNRQSKVAAQAAEDLRKLEIQAIRAQGFAKFFERAAEESRRIRDDEEQALQARLKATAGVEENLSANQKVRVNTLEQEIEALKKANANWQNNDKVVIQIEQRQANIRDIEEEITGKLTENINARQAILKLIDEQAKIESGAAAADARLADDKTARKSSFNPDFLRDAGVEQLKIQDDINKKLLKANEDFYKADAAAKARSVAAKAHADEVALAVTSNVLSAAEGLFEQNTEAYKVLATAQVLIDTYVGAQRSYNALAGIVPAGPALGAAAAAAAIIAGLGRVAAINGVTFAEGGYTGAGGKYQPAGVVHAGEVVWSQKDVAAVGGPMVANSMRPTARGFADGGFVSNEMINPFQMAQITANAIKNMPAPVIGVREFTKVANRVLVKEQISKR